MNKNKLAANSLDQAGQLRSIVGELTEIHSLLAMLCSELGGGGIVRARQLEPVLAGAVPKLRHALRVLGAETDDAHEPRREPPPNPLLM